MILNTQIKLIFIFTLLGSFACFFYLILEQEKKLLFKKRVYDNILDFFYWLIIIILTDKILNKIAEGATSIYLVCFFVVGFILFYLTFKRFILRNIYYFDAFLNLIIKIIVFPITALKTLKKKFVKAKKNDIMKKQEE